MSSIDLGKQLYALLPAVYRERDNGSFDANGNAVKPGDMAKLLTAYGGVLDGLHGSLQQRYYDNFPDLDEELDEHNRERSCQPWLLPYFAQLLDVRLVSPDTDGQRAEISNAIAWRQRKGTRVAAEQVAQAVGRMEVEIQEGWRRLALTPRIGAPLMPANHFGEVREIPESAAPAARASHPGIPAVTPDLRYQSRAVRSNVDNPATQQTVFGEETVSWRQAQLHGAPCFRDGFQDRSLRTPDIRTPRFDRGHYHPRRVLLYTPPSNGYFPPGAAGINWSTIDDLEIPASHPLIEISSSRIERNGETLTMIHYRGLTPSPLRVLGTMDLTERMVYRFENIWLDNRLQVTQGVVEIINSAARNLIVSTVAEHESVVVARGCVFKSLDSPDAPVTLEFCTLLEQLAATALYASDCIVLPRPQREASSTDVPAAGCLRFSRYPFIPAAQWLANGNPALLQAFDNSCSHRQPVFFSRVFGQPGCAVLHPAAHPEITSGAEDGGEMGAYHPMQLALRAAAVLDKLKDYMPVGMEAVLTPDPGLLCAPPEDN